MPNSAGYITHHDLASWDAWPEWAEGRWPSFKPWEFRSGSSREFLISCELLDGIQSLRNAVGVPLYINQPEHGLRFRGYRTERDNASINGAATLSQHLSGRASDVDARGAINPFNLGQAAKKIQCFKQGGIIVYPTFVHLDVRPDGPYHGTK